MSDYEKQLEKQIEELQKQLGKAQVDLEEANKLIKSKDIKSEDVYSPINTEKVDDWYLYSIKSAPQASCIWFHIKRNIKGFFSSREENFNFTVACRATTNNKFSVDYYSYPEGKSYDYVPKIHKICDCMFNIARQNGFVYVGNHKGVWTVRSHGITGNKFRYLHDGRIIVKDEV